MGGGWAPALPCPGRAGPLVGAGPLAGRLDGPAGWLAVLLGPLCSRERVLHLPHEGGDVQGQGIVHLRQGGGREMSDCRQVGG